MHQLSIYLFELYDQFERVQTFPEKGWVKRTKNYLTTQFSNEDIIATSQNSDFKNIYFKTKQVH